MIVVDTSVLIDLFRGRKSPAVARLEWLEREGTPFYVPMICCQEVLQGAKDDREWRLLADTLQTQRLLAPRDPWATHREAARIYFDCRRRGITLRSTVDCLIAQLALDEEMLLLHNDGDFEAMREVRPLRTLRE